MRTFSLRPPPGPKTVPLLRVQVQGGEISVTAVNSDYVATYHKPITSSQLIAKSFPRREDKRVAMTSAEFLIAASGLANAKARELGWIV
jgi:hypothetical protein